MKQPLIPVAMACLTLCASMVAAESSQLVERWQKAAVQKHPALAQAGSPLNQRFLAIVSEKRASDPAFFQKPDWPMRAAEAAAEALRKDELAAKEKAKAEMERGEAERAKAEEIAGWEKEWERDKARWLFERLVFGDSEETIVRKLGLSKVIKARATGPRVDLNARFRWTLGESRFDLSFEIKEGLAVIAFDSFPEAVENLDSLIREDWDKLRTATIERFGQPTKSGAFPTSDKLRRGSLTETDIWEQPGRRVRLGISEDGGKCSATMRISDPARVAD